MKTTDKRLSPLMHECLIESDTQEIINRALEIASAHTHYKADAEKARFVSFYTESEVKEDRKPSHPYIRVAPGTVYEIFRFEKALQAARVKPE